MEATRLYPEMCTHRRPKLPRKIVNHEFWRKSLSGCEHICFNKQLLPQIDIYYGEVTRNNEMASLETLLNYSKVKYNFSKFTDSGNCIFRKTCCIVFDLKRKVS